MVAGTGIEPVSDGYEPSVLPLDHPASITLVTSITYITSASASTIYFYPPFPNKNDLPLYIETIFLIPDQE
jgi:hypothetical protein